MAGLQQVFDGVTLLHSSDPHQVMVPGLLGHHDSIRMVAAGAGIDLVLGGHTHDGQACPPAASRS